MCGGSKSAPAPPPPPEPTPPLQADAVQNQKPIEDPNARVSPTVSSASNRGLGQAASQEDKNLGKATLGG